MNTDPHNPETLALYRMLSDDQLLLLLKAFEMDAAQPRLSAETKAFIFGRLAIIQKEITRRTKYPVEGRS